MQNSNNSQFHASIQFRMWACMFVAMILTIIIPIGLRAVYIRSDQAMYDQMQHEHQQEFDEDIALHSEGLRLFATSNAYGDAMVRFIKTKDPVFAKDRIASVMKLHGAAAAWVYDTAGNLTYTSTAAKTANSALAVPGVQPVSMRALFDKQEVAHFYAEDSQGIMEVYGVPIRATVGPPQSVPLQGYFFVGRLLDDTYMAEFSKSSETKVTLVNAKAATIPEQYGLGDGKIGVHRPLVDAQGRAVADLRAVFDATSLQNLYNTQNRMTFVRIAAFLLLEAGFIGCLSYWVLAPLTRIYRTLQTKDTAPIASMVTQPGEFGQIARLIAHYFDQQRDLTSEVVSQRDTQVKLEKQTAELGRINSLMIGRELRMAELKRRNTELEKKLAEVSHA